MHAGKMPVGLPTVLKIMPENRAMCRDLPMDKSYCPRVGSAVDETPVRVADTYGPRPMHSLVISDPRSDSLIRERHDHYDVT